MDDDDEIVRDAEERGEFRSNNILDRWWMHVVVLAPVDTTDTLVCTVMLPVGNSREQKGDDDSSWLHQLSGSLVAGEYCEDCCVAVVEAMEEPLERRVDAIALDSAVVVLEVPVALVAEVSPVKMTTRKEWCVVRVLALCVLRCCMMME